MYNQTKEQRRQQQAEFNAQWKAHRAKVTAERMANIKPKSKIVDALESAGLILICISGLFYAGVKLAPNESLIVTPESPSIAECYGYQSASGVVTEQMFDCLSNKIGAGTR